MGLLSDSLQISKLELPADTNINYDHAKAVVAGFGLDWVKFGVDKDNKLYRHGGSSGKLKFAKTSIVPNEKCELYQADPIYNSHMCAKVTQHGPKEGEGICSVSSL